MKPAHFLNLRWKQDYRFVTELRGRGVGPLEQVGLRLQQTKPDPWALYEETVSGVGDVITLFGRKFLEFDGRRAVWQHSLVYPAGGLDREAARGIYRAAYGGDPGLLLPVLYELLAPLEHWEGDPLVRRMFLGAATPPPEPIAATLIRELWSSRQPPGPELSAQLDALEGILVAPHASGVLDEPTPEERAALEKASFDGEDPAGLPQPTGCEQRGDEPTAPGPQPSSAERPFDDALEWHNAQWSDSADASLLGQDSARAAPEALAQPVVVEAWVSEPEVSGPEVSEPLQAPSLPSAERPDSSGLPPAELVEPVGVTPVSLSTITPARAEFCEDVFRPLTEEVEPVEEELEVDVLAENDGTPGVDTRAGGEEPSAEEPIVPAQGPPSAPLQGVELLEFEEDEEDEKTVVAPLTPSEPSSAQRREPEPSLDIPPLSEAETHKNSLHSNASQLVVLSELPLTPPSEVASFNHQENQASEAFEDRKKPMIIGGLLGLVAALLALWMVWVRVSGPSDTTGEDALTSATVASASPPAEPGPLGAEPPSPLEPPSVVVGTEEPGELPKSPPAAEVFCFTDKDQDGYGHKSPQRAPADGGCPVGTAPRGGDCNDNDPLVSPGAEELCDQRDNNCNPTVDDNDNLRDDNKDGKLDCLQTDPGAGMGRLKVSGEVKGGSNGQAPYLFIEVALPEGSRGLCKQELRFGRGVSGSQTRQKFTYIAATQKCGVPVAGGALPRGLDPCVKGMSIAEKAEKVAVEAACCMQNQGSYGTYLTTKRVGDMESCEYLQTNSSINVKAGMALSLPLDPPPISKPGVATPP